MKSCLHTSRQTDSVSLSLMLAGILSGVMRLGGQAQQAREQTSCTDARVGSAEAYSCVNQKLYQQGLRQHATGGGGSIDATAPAPQVGTYNQAAVREHLGSNFGKSAVPQRPPANVFPPPLIPAH